MARIQSAFVCLAITFTSSHNIRAEENAATIPIVHFSVRAGLGDGGVSQNFAVWSSATPDYSFGGIGLNLALCMVVGNSNFRWLVKAKNLWIPSGDNATYGDIFGLTTGVQYNSSRVGTSFIAELSVGAANAWAKMYDSGWDGCDWLNCYPGESRAPSWANMSLGSLSADLSAGFRLNNNFELLGNLWIGPQFGVGLGIDAGYWFGL